MASGPLTVGRDNRVDSTSAIAVEKDIFVQDDGLLSVPATNMSVNA